MSKLFLLCGDYMFNGKFFLTSPIQVPIKDVAGEATIFSIHYHIT